MIAENAQSLRDRLLAADLSLNNPGIQTIIENEVAHWVKSYREKKEGPLLIHDCYGGPGEIPDQITLDDSTYSPEQILEHVKARDKEGMEIMQRLYTYHNDVSINGDGRDGFAESITRAKNIDQVIMSCGKKMLSWRDLVESMINAEPDSLPLTIGWKEAIQSLYTSREKLATAQIRAMREERAKPWYAKLGKMVRSVFGRSE